MIRRKIPISMRKIKTKPLFLKGLQDYKKSYEKAFKIINFF